MSIKTYSQQLIECQVELDRERTARLAAERERDEAREKLAEIRKQAKALAEFGEKTGASPWT